MTGHLMSGGRAARSARTLVSLSSFGRLLIGGVATVAIALPATAQAEVSPQMRAARIQIEHTQGKGPQPPQTIQPSPFANLGEVCNTSRATWVWKTGTLEKYYEVGYNTPMRIENWAGPYYYIAHAEGKPNGEIERAAINQSSCHKT
jgi:hypothetical protein